MNVNFKPFLFDLFHYQHLFFSPTHLPWLFCCVPFSKTTIIFYFSATINVKVLLDWTYHPFNWINSPVLNLKPRTLFLCNIFYYGNNTIRFPDIMWNLWQVTDMLWIQHAQQCNVLLWTFQLLVHLQKVILGHSQWTGMVCRLFL